MCVLAVDAVNFAACASTAAVASSAAMCAAAVDAVFSLCAANTIDVSPWSHFWEPR